MSPGMAAAAAVSGRLADVRQFQRRGIHSSRAVRMQAFVDMSGATMAGLPMNNIDTDMIIPKQFLKTVKRTGLGKHAFDELRFNQDGTEKMEFVLNQPQYRTSSVLVTGRNFGCGSSREHAPWALLDFGIRVVISESFADIFFSNCFKNGILPLALPSEHVKTLLEDAAAGRSVSVSLESCKVTRSNGDNISFTVDEFRRESLLKGLDEIGQTLEHEAKITAFEERRRAATPWM